ncbi:hypothetical protein [Ferruginibacter sp. SUN106]|uniref:hypothetical protein n=1 Tax=Ferruginibacter sp. SUN106 TaxID=2978348 RepID=UPI003D36B8CB
MKYFITSLVCILITQLSTAQKKVMPATQSIVTAITLPAGAKKDSRLLTEVAAKALLQSEAKNTGATVNNIEVLYLPVTFTADSLNQLFNTSGWTATPSATDKKCQWLQKDGHAVIAYISSGKNQTELYLGETNGASAQQQTTTGVDMQQQNQTTAQQTTTQQTDVQQPTQSNDQPVVKDGYAFNTTNFDDGWSSVIQDDWILVSKGDIKVYLWYALPYNASDFSGTGIVDRDYYWDNYVSKYFNIETKQYKDNGEVMSSQKPRYIEGWATDKQSGEKRFIGMRLDISPNTAYITIASAKDEASLWQQFPKANGDAWSPSDLSNMGSYNKFAIGENDISGTWQDGNTATMQWYYTAASGNPGGYAGMTVAARSATFNFNTGGNYTSIHNGATGVVGAMNTFQQNYKGRYTVSNWSITATNRWEGKTENFNSWFKVIRGGRILCMDAGGMQYRLVKSK